MELKAQIAEIDSQIRREGERLARQFDNDATVAGDRVKTLTASLDQVKKVAAQSNTRDVELRALQREAKTQRDLLEAYLAKYREASARDSINAAPPEARIVSRAAPATRPNYPKKLATVLIAAFAGFALSAGFTVTGALLAAPTVPYGYGTNATSADAAYPAAATPFIASPPLMPSPSPVHSPPPEFVQPTLTPMAASSLEAIAADLRQAGDDGRRVAVIGSARHVGTTSAALALARALSQEASVVLVDMAFAAPVLSLLSDNPQAPGLADLLRGTASFGDIITNDPHSNLQLVAAGHVGNDGPALVASPMLATAVEALVRSYDHVVIDAGAVADAALTRLSPLARCAVLVSDAPAVMATGAAAERLSAAGFADVALLAGGVRAAA
jgi:Mrp family chromosome partitioning ATPase